MIIFENDCIVLRDAEPKDAEGLLSITNDKEVMRYYGMAPYKDLKEAQDEIDWFLSLQRNGNGARWVIADKNSDEYIGDVGVFDYDNYHNRIEIGFKLRKEYWGRGIMSNCISILLKFCFLQKNVNRVHAMVDTNNIGCARTLEKSGFKLEGILREYEFENGKYVDLKVFSILKREYIG